MADSGGETLEVGGRSLPLPVVAVALGAAVAIGLGAYGQVHDPTGRSLYTLFFTNTIRLKAWFATVCAVLAVSQVATAAWIYGRMGGDRHAPPWLGDFHRLIGTLTFGFSLPVAFNCLWALGYQTTTTRVAVHSLLGCAFYGAYTVKVFTVRRIHQPVWMLPAIGAFTAALLVAIWWTSSLWFFRNVTWAI